MCNRSSNCSTPAVQLDSLVFNACWDHLTLKQRERVRSRLRALARRSAHVPGACLAEADLREEVLRNITFDGGNLRGVVLDRALLEGIRFFGTELQGVSLRAARLIDVHFHGAVGRRTTFDRARLERCTFQRSEDADSQLQQADFHRARIDSVEFDHVQLDEASFSTAKLNDTTFRSCVCRNADLQNMTCQRTCFLGGEYSRSRFTDSVFFFPATTDPGFTLFGAVRMPDCELDGVICEVEQTAPPDAAAAPLPYRLLAFDRCCLSNSDLSSSKLDHCVFDDVDATSCSFAEAGLLSAKFIGGKLISAVFSGTKLENTVFDRAEIVASRFDNTVLDGAAFNGAETQRLAAQTSIFPAAVFRKCSFHHCDFSVATLSQARFDLCLFSGACAFNDASLAGTVFQDCTFNESTSFKDADLTGAHFASPSRGENHVWDLSGCRLSDADLQGVNLSKCNLRGAILENAQLLGCRFDEAELVEARFLQCNMRGSVASDARFHGCRILDCVLLGTRFESCHFVNADFSGSYVVSADLGRDTLELAKMGVTEAAVPPPTGSSASFLCCDFSGALLRNCILVGSDFRGSTLIGAVADASDFRSADLRGVIVSRASFVGCRFGSGWDVEDGNSTVKGDAHVGCRRADAKPIDRHLECADLREAVAVGTSFFGADLAHVDLRGADLSEAKLDNAKVNGAHLWGCHFRAASLVGVVGFDEVQLEAVPTGTKPVRPVWDLPDFSYAHIEATQSFQVSDSRWSQFCTWINDGAMGAGGALGSHEHERLTRRRMSWVAWKNNYQSLGLYEEQGECYREERISGGWRRAHRPLGAFSHASLYLLHVGLFGATLFLGLAVAAVTYGLSVRLLGGEQAASVCMTVLALATGTLSLWLGRRIPANLTALFWDVLYGFGEQPWKIGFNAVGAVAIFGLFYCYAPLVGGGIFRSERLVTLWGDCLYFSAVAFTTLGSSDLLPYEFCRFLAGVESFLGLVMAALFIHAIARRTAGR